MIDYENTDLEKPYLLISPKGYLVEKFTGAIVCSVLDIPPDRIKRIRNQIDWDASLSHDTEKLGDEFALENLISLYHHCYWEYPDFTPGFVLYRNRKTQDEDDDNNRGLSNTNKVHGVVLRNNLTGEFITIDKSEARLSRMRRRVFSWADTLKGYLQNIQDYRKVMVTLTYAGVDDWKPNDIRDYMKALKRKLGRDLVASAWVGELQKRGAVHYHVILVCKKGTNIPKPDESGMWTHGLSRIETAKTVFYLCSYLKKEYQKEGDFPKGMNSVWIAKWAVEEIAHWRMRLSSLPRWFAKKVTDRDDHRGEKWERNEGGGYRFAGILFRSPYKFYGLAVEEG